MSVYGKREATAVAGVAILLMVWHHLFTYPNWLLDDCCYHSAGGRYVDLLVWLVGRIGNICIYMFAFSSGYAIYSNWEGFDSITKRVKRISRFLFSYWLVCAAFLIYGFVAGEILPQGKDLLMNMVGLNTGFYKGWINVTFGWYVFYYVCVILICPFLKVLLRVNEVWLMISLILAIVILLSGLYYTGGYGFFSPLPSTICGMLTAKYKLFQRIKNQIDGCGVFTMIGFMLLILALRCLSLMCESNIDSDYWLVVFSIFEALLAMSFIAVLLSLLNRSHYLTFILVSIGELSMFIWFTHSILFTGSRSLQPYFYDMEEPLMIFVITITIFSIVSYCFKWVNSKICPKWI